jgi:hypothetical protein
MPSLLPDAAKYDLDRQLQACQSKSRRNGKVARLPANLREQINLMLDEGLPYKLIIQKLSTAGQPPSFLLSDFKISVLPRNLSLRLAISQEFSEFLISSHFFSLFLVSSR